MNLWNSKSGEFYDEWETASEELRQETINSRLKEYLNFAKDCAPFFKLKNYSINYSNDFPLKDLAPMTSDDIAPNVPPQGNSLLTRQPNDCIVFQSGGTTGMPKTSLFTHDELEQLNLCNARGFYACGLTPDDRVANLWAVGGLYMTFIHIGRMLQQYGCQYFPFSNQTPSNYVQSVSELFKINCFTGITSVVLNCLRDMHNNGVKDLQIDKIYFGGEHIYPGDKKELYQKFGVKKILAPGYGTVDTWYLGYQCEKCPNGVFHAHDDQCYIEMVNEGTGKNCSMEEVGMLYATPFPRKLTPVIRYRVGDRAKWISEKCTCGRTTPLFELLGRGDDILRVGYDSISYNSIQENISKVRGLTATLQMEKSRLEGKDLLTIRIETEEDKSNYEKLVENIKIAIMEDRPSLNEFIKKGTIQPLDVVLCVPGTIERNSRTGKLIRVKDVL